ncbi:hypothetical protein JKA74_20610, partial [Marivirga sp. S37H4]
GTGNYTFTLGGDAAATQTQPGAIYRFNNLSAGNYTIDLEDANNCSITQQNVTLTEPVAISATAAITSNFNGAELSCFGASDGEITTTAGNGSGGYTYVLNEEPSNTTGDANGIYTGLAAGSYTVTVTDNNGCSATTTSIVIDNPPVIVNTASSDITLACKGDSDGSGSFTASGGTPPYIFTVDANTSGATILAPSATTQGFNNASVGLVTVTIADANGCSEQQTINITEPSLDLTAGITGTTSICDGENTSLTFDLSGNGVNYDVIYTDGSNNFNLASISDGHNIIVNPLETKTYSIVEATDISTGCTNAVLTGSATVTVNTIPTTPIADTYNPFCVDDDATTTTVNAVSGTNISWYQESSLSTLLTTGASPTLSSLNIPTADNGSFTRYATQADADGCESPALEINIIIFDAPVFDPIPTDINRCPGELVDIDFSTLSASDNITWSADNTAIGNPASGTNSLTFVTSANNTGSDIVTTITVSATNDGCSTPVTETFTITLNPTPTIPAFLTPIKVCRDNNLFDLTSINLNASPAGGTYSYAGNGVSGTIFDAGHASVSLGFQEIEVTYISLDGCERTKDIILLDVIELPIANLPTPSDNTCENASYDLIGNIGGSATSGLWQLKSGEPAAGSLSATTNNSGDWTATFSPDGIYIGDLTFEFIASGSATNPCDDDIKEFILTIDEAPISAITTTATEVCEADPFTLQGTVSGGANNGEWQIKAGQGASVDASGSLTATTNNSGSWEAVFTPNGSYFGNVTFEFVASAPNSCSDHVEEHTLTIFERPTATLPANFNTCGDAAFDLDASLTGSTLNGEWTIIANGDAGQLTATN